MNFLQNVCSGAEIEILFISLSEICVLCCRNVVCEELLL